MMDTAAKIVMAEWIMEEAGNGVNVTVSRMISTQVEMSSLDVERSALIPDGLTALELARALDKLSRAFHEARRKHD